MNSKKIRLDLKMYYGTEEHKENWAAVLVPAKTIYKFPTKDIKDINEVDLFMISFDWDTAYDYVGYFLKKHLKNDSKTNVWAHNRYMKYQDEEYFNLAKDLKDINNYFSINDMYEVTDDIRNTIKCLQDNIENEDTKELFRMTKSNYDLDDFSSVKDQVIFFLKDFINRLEFMLKISKEKDMDLIEWISA